MPSIKITGATILQKLINRLEKITVELSQPKAITLSELFTTSFMQEYTIFSSFDGLLAAGGFKVRSQEEFENIPDDVFDQHIAATTKFKNWSEMFDEAAIQYALIVLGH